MRSWWFILAAAASVVGQAYQDQPLQCFQVQHPVWTDQGAMSGNRLLDARPENELHNLESCQLTLMQHSFQNSYGHPFVANYVPPKCQFNRVVMNFTVTSQGRQFDRLAIMYLGDNEVWRTSTAEPKQKPGIAWTYWKDMSPYLTLWKQPQRLIFDLGNLMDATYTGAFNTTLTATFINEYPYNRTSPHAPLILPISGRRSSQGQGSAFQYPGDDASTRLTFPKNIVRAVTTISATGQADEEFWWSNFGSQKANISDPNGVDKGAFREVQLYIDGQLAGLAWPFPVVFTGGIAPPIHRPLVGLQAFDLLETEIDISPWLGTLCDGEQHEFRLKVVGEYDKTVASHWLLTGKVFAWLDAGNHQTRGTVPKVTIEARKYNTTQNAVGSGIVYAQKVMRQLKVSSNLEIEGNGRPSVTTWSQRFSMINNGHIKNKGNYQLVDAWYEGEASIDIDAASNFYNGFAYPIRAIVDTKGNPKTGLRSNVELDQRQMSTTTGATVFSNGLQPFIKHLNFQKRQAIGFTIDTRRLGRTSYYQDAEGRTGVENNKVEQWYYFGARDGYKRVAEQNFHNYILLYKRHVKEEAEATVEDDELVTSPSYKAPPARVAPDNNLVGQFAPMPMKSAKRIGGFWGKGTVPPGRDGNGAGRFSGKLLDEKYKAEDIRKKINYILSQASHNPNGSLIDAGGKPSRQNSRPILRH